MSNQESQSSVGHEEKVKIGGWLMVVGAVLWLSVLGTSFNVLAELLALVAHLPATPWLLVTGVINLALVVPMLVMFHRRKAALVWWIVVYAIYVVVDECYVQYRHIVQRDHVTLAGHIVAVALEALLMGGVVMYFFKSKRVKRTFVR